MMVVNVSNTVNNVARLDSRQKQNVVPKKDTDSIMVNVVTFSHGELICKRIGGIQPFLLLLL